MKEEMQRERVAGFKEFIEDIQQQKFPAAEHVVKAPENLLADFLDKLASDS